MKKIRGPLQEIQCSNTTSKKTSEIRRVGGNKEIKKYPLNRKMGVSRLEGLIETLGQRMKTTHINASGYEISEC